MSIKIITSVWDKSQHKGNNLLALLALADNANDDGYCWPGLDNIAQRTRVSRQTAIRCIARLEETAELFVSHNRRHGNKYLVIVNCNDEHIKNALEKYFKMTPEDIQQALYAINDLRVKCQNDTYQIDTSEVNPSSHEKSHSCDTSEVNPSSQEPSSNRQKKPSKETTQPHIAIIDAYWQGLPGGKPVRDTYERHVKLASQMRDAGIVPQDVIGFMAKLYNPSTAEWEYKKRQGRAVSLEEVADLLPVWKAKFTPKVAPLIDLDTPEAVAYRQRAAMGWEGQTPETRAMLERIMTEAGTADGTD